MSSHMSQKLNVEENNEEEGNHIRPYEDSAHEIPGGVIIGEIVEGAGRQETLCELKEKD